MAITLNQGQTLYDTKTGKALGTVQYDTKTGKALQQGQTTQYLPPTTTPTNSSQVNGNFPSVNIPNTQYPQGSPTGAIAATTGMSTQLDILQKQYKDQADAAKAELDRVTSEQNSNKSILAGLLNNTKTQSQTRADTFASIGVDPASYFADQKAGIAEINTLSQEFNAVKAAKEQQIAQTYSNLSSNNFINNQQAQIERNAAPKLNMLSANINAKAATLQAMQGNFNEATSFVNQAVQDATADTKFQLDAFQMFYDMNQDAISRLDSNYRNALDKSMAIAEKVYNEDVANKKAVGEAMLQYNGIGAGILITDSIEEAQRKAASVGGDIAIYKKQQQLQKQYSSSAGDSETSVNAFGDVLQAAIDAGATPFEAARAAATVSENQGIPVSQDTLNKWAKDAANLKKSITVSQPEITNTTTTPKTSLFNKAQTSFNSYRSNPINYIPSPTIRAVGNFFSNLFGS